MIQLNYTLLIQLINFIILLLVLNAILYKPILNKIREREARIQGDRDKAGELAKSIEDQETQHEEALASARQTAAQEKGALLAEAKKTESDILGKARDESAKIVDEMKASINKEAAQVRTALQEQMAPLAQSIAEKLLGRAV